METAPPLTESTRGYLSEQSKKRFTLVAGLLGGACFLSQFILPFLLMFAVMFPMMMTQEFRSSDLHDAALWRGEVWFVEHSDKLNWRHPGSSPRAVSLRQFHTTDLSDGPTVVPIDVPESASDPVLLPQGDRLWLIGTGTVGYYENGAITQLTVTGRPIRASRPFIHDDHPALIAINRSPYLALLHVENGTAEWRKTTVPLELPLDVGWVKELQVVQVGSRQYWIAEACTDEPQNCTLLYQEDGRGPWQSLATDESSRSSWSAVALGGNATVVIVGRSNRGPAKVSLVTVTPDGPRRQEVEHEHGRFGSGRSSAFSSGSKLLLVSEGMPGSRKLMELADGKVVRSTSKDGGFPFPGNMMAVMFLLQLSPVALSLALAFFLTAQMRKHRVQTYVANGQQRTFASLWQRAWAQVIDALVLGAGFVPPMLWMRRMFSDPEQMVESMGPKFPLVFFGLFAVAFLWAFLMIVVFSYLEGRFGKTPGKWLLRIRVLGTDLAPCGFWRALVRNLLTFVDGFFNFLVGLLLVALSDNWQRLGDLAGRTLVVVDEKVEPRLS